MNLILMNICLHIICILNIKPNTDDDLEVIAEEPLEIEKTLDLSRFLQNAVRNNRDNNQELESKMNKQINLKAFNKEEDYNLAELAAMFLK
ncbi:7277_t:CDS:2 [Funneliformis geosporum]|uniref:7277_t:CDS:1 n=1 Tax=Funneliformis geosporum TaxID=1117311 RepID=A0A9W4WMQ3_9GLOM|nr:7277_t:CDS:2 [Funneliformis geosporum]